jgi:hypothetical protein
MSVRPGPARTWRIALSLPALVSFLAVIPLTVLSHQASDGVIAADPDAVRTDLAGVVHTALEPTHVSVWLHQ